MQRLAILVMVGCAHPVRTTTPPVARPPSPPPVAAPTWPVPVHVMTWTEAGPRTIGELPDHPPASYPNAWFVEPVDRLDLAQFRKLVVTLRSERIPGLSLRGEPASSFLTELHDLPDLHALVLDDTDVDDAALATMDVVLARLYLARTAIDDAGVVALAAKHRALEVLDVEDCDVGDTGARAIATLGELHALNLAGTTITDTGGALVGGLGKLAILDLGGTLAGPKTIAAVRLLPLNELFVDRSRIGADVAKLAALAPTLQRFDASSLVKYHPTDDEVGWLVNAGNLVEIGLSGSRVHDPLVLAFAKLPALRELRLAGAPITIAAVRAIAARTDLEEVDLADTPIDDPAVAQLIKAPAMRVLRVDHTGVTDAALRGVPTRSLRELYLSQTHVTDVGLEILDGLPDLESLGLGQTAVADATIERISRLAQLRTLVLSKTRAGASLAKLGALRRLERLYLNETHTGDDELAALASLAELRVLHLAGTDVSDEALPTLRSFHALDELTLGDTRMHSAIADVSAWPHLRTLSLLGLQIDDAGVAQIARRTSLVVLDLSDTEITDPTPLSALPHLRTLGLTTTKLSTTGLAAVKSLVARGVEVVR